MLSVTLYQIQGFLYQLSDEPVKEGDLVYNVRDNTYGRADKITASRVGIKYEGMVETVAKTSVFKLVPSSINN